MTHIKFENLILCSSDFPKDADFEKLRTKLEKSRLYFIYGSNDDIFAEKNYKESMDLLNENEIEFKEIVFSGKHEINEDSINFILRK